jgi:hypothetical protein
MRAREFLVEKEIARFNIGGMTVIVDDHTIDQAVKRMVLPTDIDRVLQKFPKIKDQIKLIEPGQKFWVYDSGLEVGLGCRRLTSAVLFKTVIGPKEGPPYNSDLPVLKV